MKQFHYLGCILLCLLGITANSWAQSCDLTKPSTLTQIQPGSYPYTASSGVTISVRVVGAYTYTYGSLTSTCDSSYTVGPLSWHIGSSGHTTDSIILTFSSPVNGFTFIFNGTDPGEIVTVNAAAGSVSLSNYCTSGFTLSAANAIKCAPSSGYNFGTLVKVNNTTGSTRYVITHNGAAAGSLINILDCVDGGALKGPAGIVDGIQFWLDGSDVNNAPGTNPADSTRLGIWKDVSGNGNNAYVLPGLDTPWLRSSRINSKDAVQFKRASNTYGSIYYMPAIDIRSTTTPQATIFTVYKQGAHGTSELQGIWGDDNGGWDRFFMSVYNSDNGVVSVGPPLNNVPIPNSGVAGQVRLLTAQFDHGLTDSSTIFFNAVPVDSTTDNTHATNAQTNFRIGWDGDDNPFNGDMAEVIMYNRKLTICEIKAINRYLGYKYGTYFTTATIAPNTTQYICSDSVKLTASAGDTYQWLKDGAVISGATGQTYYASLAGNYQVVIGASGCADTSIATAVANVPTVIYVDSAISASGDGSSWATAKKTVAEALRIANRVKCPLSIWVKKGTYYPTADGNRDSSLVFYRNGIKLYGGFAGTESALSDRSVNANPTILSGDLGVANDSTDNSYHVLTMIASATNKIDTTTTIDGFTITRGNALGMSGSFSYGGVSLPHTDGAALELYGAGAGNTCSPLIANCIFTRNSANFGGAIYAGGMVTGLCSPVIRNTTFSNNRANNSGGAVICNGQTSGNVYPVLDNVIFKNNTASDGGGFYILKDGSGTANVTIRNCSFTNNTVINGGGAFGSYLSSGTISNTVFARNTAGYSGGAMQVDGGVYTLISNLLDSNISPIGGAIRMYPDNPSVKAYKNVFYRNVSTAADAGGMSIVSGTGTDTLINNVFIRNKVLGTSSLNNGGGAFVQEGGTSTYIVNNTFYADSSSVSGGAIHFKDGGTNRYLYNNIFYKNQGGSTTTDISFASSAAITAQSNNTFSGTDPVFVNELLPLGADGLWTTADDGLRLRPCSPAVDSGLNSAVVVTDDILGATRIQYTTVDRGAYEEQTHLLPVVPTTTTAITYCQGSVASVLNATPASGTDTLKWYNAVPTLLGSAPTPVTTDTGSFVYYVSVGNIAGCESAKAKITVRVNTTPAVPTTTTPIVYCQNATAVALTATASLSTDTLKWYNASSTALSGAPTPSTTATGSTTYYVSARNGLACESAKQAITVTVNTTPTTPTATTPITYCQGVTATVLTATKGTSTDTLKWYDATPVLLSGAPTPSTTTPGSTTYYVSGKNSFGCESPKKTIVVNVNSTPAAPVSTTPVIYCQNATATALTATKGTSADTLKWYDATPALLSGAPTPSTTTVGSVIYYVSEKTGAGCEGPKTAITVTVNTTPATPTATTPVVYCQGVTPTALTATKGTSTDTLKWYDNASTLLSGAPTPSTTGTGSTNYYVSGKNSFGCESPKKTIVVTVNATPAAPAATSPITYCQDDVAAVLTATKGTSSDTLRWFDASSALLAGAPTPLTATPGTTSYYVSEKTPLGCEGPKTTITVTVNPKPVAPTVVSPIDICVGVTPSALVAAGTNLKWYKALSGGTGTTTLMPDVTATGTTSYYVSQTTALGCEGPRAELKVNVHPSPIVNIAPSGAPAFVYCHGDDITIKALSTTATSYQWYRDNLLMGSSIDDSLVVNTTADYSVIVKDFYGCADTASVHVIENPLPVPSLSPTNVYICPGVSIMLYARPGNPDYRYEWFKDGIAMPTSILDNNVAVNAAGIYSVKVTDYYNCAITTNTSSVNLYPAMTPPVIDGTRSPLLMLTASYASYQWNRNGRPISGANARSYTASFDGDYTVDVMDANGCTATSPVYALRTTGISEQNLNNAIRLYPNPTQNRVNIEAAQPVNVRVTDVTGRVVLEQQQAQVVDLEPFADGMYVFILTNADNVPVMIEKVHKASK